MQEGFSRVYHKKKWKNETICKCLTRDLDIIGVSYDSYYCATEGVEGCSLLAYNNSYNENGSKRQAVMQQCCDNDE